MAAESNSVAKKGIGFKYGLVLAKNPVLGLLVVLALVAAFTPGLLMLEITNDQNDLWVNKDGTLYAEQKISDENFGRFFRAEQIIFRPRDGSEVDMIQKEYLQELFWFQEIAKRTVINWDGKNWTVHDLCWSALPNSKCTIQSPLGFWQNNYTRLMNDKDPHYTTQCLNSIDPNNTLACMDETGIPVQTKVVFGGLTKVYDTSASSSISSSCLSQSLAAGIDAGAAIDDCTAYVYNAKALVVTFLLNDTDRTNKISMEWEQKAIIDTADLWKRSTDTSEIRKRLPDLDIPVKKLNLDMNYMVGRSIPDELKAESQQNSYIVLVSYTLMLLYVTCSLGHFPSTHGKPTILIGLAGILIVALSVVIGYAATSYLGVKSSMISLEVIPFLILAIGVDNMFIITQAIEREPHRSLEIKVAHAIEECSPSILVACITEVVTFAVGISTNIPALKVFCMTAVFAILANFVLQMTAFIAVLVFDMKRTPKKPLDADEHDSQSKTNRVQEAFTRWFTPFVKQRVVNLVVLVVAVVMVAFAWPCFDKLKLGLEQQISVRTDGVLFKYFNDLATYFESGPQGYIVIKDAIPNGDTGSFLQSCTDLLTQRGTLITPPIQNWMADFLRYYSNPDNLCVPTVDPFNLTTCVQEFQNITMDSYCCQKNGICGQQYYQHIKNVTDDGIVKYSRVMFLHSPVRTQEDFIRNYDETHQLIASLQANLTAMAQANDDYKEKGLMPTIYAQSMFYIYFEQYTYIKGLAVQNLLVSMLLLFGIVASIFTLIVAFDLVVIIFFQIFSMITIIYATNWLFGGWEIMINAVSVVNLVTAVGFAVEFSVHTLLKYNRTEGPKSYRITTAMNTMGSSVFSGIFCTKLLGISILAIAPSALFRVYYFRMYIIMIILCGFYGLLFLPAYLFMTGSDKKPSKRTDANDMYETGSVTSNSVLNPLTINSSAA